MRRGFSLATAAALVIGAMLVKTPPSAAQNVAVEYQVKAAFLYNFAKFVRWPDEAFSRPSDPFTICLEGDPFGGTLERTIGGETLNGRPLVVRRLSPSDSVRGCHMVYVAPSQSRRSAQIINSAGMSALLTVGEAEDFITRGGMIRFIESRQRIRFQINPDAAERASLRVSSRLLRLADIVRPRQRGGE